MIDKFDINFEDTRPYNDEEIPAAIQRIANNTLFPTIVHYLFPNENISTFKEKLCHINSVDGFQKEIMYPAICSIINKTSAGLTCSGFDKLSNLKKGMLLSNHRDILLDAAILQIIFFEHHLDTAEITFGDNLMRGQLVIDIGKANKMFKIVRGGNISNFFRNSLIVSSYMRHAICNKNQFTWIAQRNGRTKDGWDKTEIAVLKMFAMSSNLPFAENLSQLNIQPIAVSYEYEPCDFLKSKELWVTKYGQYIKAPDEDLYSILQGINQPKGHIHFAAPPPITRQELDFCDQFEKNEKFNQLAQIIDMRIYANYKLWKTNYIAYDLSCSSNQFHDYYSNEDKANFILYMENGLSQIEGNNDELKDIFIHIYANPVANKIKHNLL